MKINSQLTLFFSLIMSILIFACAQMESKPVLLPTDGSPSIIKQIRVGFNPIGVAITHDDRIVYTANSTSNSISKINTENYKVESTIEVQENPVWVAISNDDKIAYITNRGAKSLTVIDISGNYVIDTIDFAYNPEQIAVHPEKPLAFVTNNNSQVVTAVDLKKNKVLKYITTTAGCSGIAITPDGRYAYVTTGDSRYNIIIIDCEDLTVIKRSNAGSFPSSVIMDSQGQYAYIANKGSNDITMVYIPEHHPTANIPVSRLPIALAMSPSGKYVYVACQKDHIIDIIETASNKVVKQVELEVTPWGITASTDGSKLYVANYNEKSEEQSLTYSPGQPGFGTSAGHRVNNNNLLVISTGEFH